jgi:hypothetical protein
MARGSNTMGTGYKNTMGKWVNIPWAGGQNTMGSGIYCGQNTMGKWVFIPWVGWSKYHG